MSTFVPVYRNCFLFAINHWSAVAIRVIQGGCKVWIPCYEGSLLILMTVTYRLMGRWLGRQ